MTEQESTSREQQTRNFDTKNHLIIDDLLRATNVGDTQGKWIPAIKEAISFNESEKLLNLRFKFPYSFENSIRYLKKEEREFIRSKVRG